MGGRDTVANDAKKAGGRPPRRRRAAVHPNKIAGGLDRGDGVFDADDGAYFSDASATLGDRLAAARQHAGLTQAALGAKLGVGPRIISAWENDRSEPRANSLTTLSGLLGTTVSWLLIGAGEGIDPPEGEAEEAPRPMEIGVVAADPDAVADFYESRLGARRVTEDGGDTVRFFGHRLRISPPAPGERLSASPNAGLRLSIKLGAGELADVRRRVGQEETTGPLLLRDPSGVELTFDVTSA